MGGGQSLNFGLGQSRHLRLGRRLLLRTEHQAGGGTVPDPEKGAKQLKLLYVSCGNKDGLIRISQNVHAYLKEKNVPHSGMWMSTRTISSIGRRRSTISPS
jgi:hypothetical protein